MGINSKVRHKNKGKYDLKEYPNPASGMVSVDLRPVMDGEILIKIFSLEGTRMHTLKFRTGEPLKIDITSLSRGIYLITAEDRMITLWQRIVLYQEICTGPE